MDLNIPHALCDRERFEHHEMEIRDLRKLVNGLIENKELVAKAMQQQDELIDIQHKAVVSLLKQLNLRGD